MIKDKVTEDMKEAMKSRDQLRLNTVRGLLSELKKEEIDTRTALTDEKCLSIIQREIKKRKDALDFAKTASRDDLIEQNQNEIQILQGYLPAQLSEENLKELIQQLIASGNDSIGKIMGALNKDHKGSFDGKSASELIKSMLG